MGDKVANDVKSNNYSFFCVSSNCSVQSCAEEMYNLYIDFPLATCTYMSVFKSFVLILTIALEQATVNPNPYLMFSL